MNNAKVSAEQLTAVLSELFDVSTPLDGSSDLSIYIKDSIDLGELLAVIKERHDVSPHDLTAFKTHVQFDDVLKIINGDL